MTPQVLSYFTVPPSDCKFCRHWACKNAACLYPHGADYPVEAALKMLERIKSHLPVECGGDCFPNERHCLVCTGTLEKDCEHVLWVLQRCRRRLAPRAPERKQPMESAIRQQVVFETTWTDCPEDVREEVHKLWGWRELSNDTSFFNWPGADEGYSVTETYGDLFPKIAAFLKERGVDKCWIRHWW